jgi:hypothetical protein
LFIPKGATLIQLWDSVVQEINKRGHAAAVSKVVVAYTVDSGTDTSTRAQTSNIFRNKPHFSMWVTGDLSFYADSQGKQNSFIHW